MLDNQKLMLPRNQNYRFDWSKIISKPGETLLDATSSAITPVRTSEPKIPLCRPPPPKSSFGGFWGSDPWFGPFWVLAACGGQKILLFWTSIWWFSQPNESRVLVFLEILVEFSHAKTTILVHGRRSHPKFGGLFRRENEELMRNYDICALKTVPEHSTGLSRI